MNDAAATSVWLTTTQAQQCMQHLTSDDDNGDSGESDVYYSR